MTPHFCVFKKCLDVFDQYIAKTDISADIWHFLNFGIEPSSVKPWQHWDFYFDIIKHSKYKQFFYYRRWTIRYIFQFDL